MTHSTSTVATGPLASALEALHDWLAGAVGAGVPVNVAAPGAAQSTALTMWPLALLPEQDTRGGQVREPLRLRARYLISVDGPIEAATRVLDRILAATAVQETYRLVLKPVPDQVWAAGSVAPRAALMIDVPVLVLRVTPAVPRVRGPLVADVRPLRSIQGRVLGPGNVPLPDIAVSAAGAPEVVRTDASGNFVIAGVPATTNALLLSGKGLHLRAQIPPVTGEPVVIRCSIEEV